MEYVSRALQPPLDELIHDVYYLAGNPPYRWLTLPAAPAPLLIINLGAPFHIRAGNHVQAAHAHFGHEFREFTGFTPTRYVEVRRRFMREHPGHVLDGWPLPTD